MGHEQPIADADVEGPIRHKLTVEEFLILDEAGVFGDQRVELIDGEIYDMSPVHRPHGEVSLMLGHEIIKVILALGLPLKCSNPVSTVINNFSLPQPDLVVAADDGGTGLMTREAVRIVIEVSSSTLRYDLVDKAGLYARADLPEYWIVDVRNRRVVRLSQPADGVYQQRAEFAFGQLLPSATIPELVVDTASL